MKRLRVILLLGIIGIAVAVITLLRNSRSEAGPLTSPRIAIRFAHPQLQAGVREAFDQIARDYMALHPDVRVEQIAVPLRTWSAFTRTQLIGGTAPDLIQIDGLPADILGRYFVPLTSFVQDPNPYNEKTDLEGLPWRTTFLEGLSSSPSYNDPLVEVMGIPNSQFTFRLFYNKSLLKEITGSDQAPDTYAEFIELCEKVVVFAKEQKRVLVPIAGSRDNTVALIRRLAAMQTQKLTQRIDPYRSMRVEAFEAALTFLRGDWSLDSPEIRNGLGLMREVGRYIQPGFLQLGREDATLYFSQQRALMVASSNQDLNSLSDDATFPVGVIDLPHPAQDHPVYGANQLGRSSEAGRALACVFGLTKTSRHPEYALDFLRFLGSYRGNQTFTQTSNWLPAIHGVDGTDKARPFVPVVEGATGGFGIHFEGFSRQSTWRLYQVNRHLIYSPQGGIEQFVTAMGDTYRTALRQDLANYAHGSIENLRLGDLLKSARQRIDRNVAAQHSRLSVLLESQNLREAQILQIEATLRAAESAHPVPAK